MTTNSGQGEKNHGGGRELIGHDERKKNHGRRTNLRPGGLGEESVGICWGGGGLGDGTGWSRHGKKIATKEAAGCRLGAGNRRGSFLSARGVQRRRTMPRCAAEYVRVKMRVREGGMPSC